MCILSVDYSELGKREPNQTKLNTTMRIVQYNFSHFPFSVTKEMVITDSYFNRTASYTHIVLKTGRPI